MGCGTGALCAAIVDRCSPSSVAGVELSGGFLRTAKENLADRAVLHTGYVLPKPMGSAAVPMDRLHEVIKSSGARNGW
ncbi:MAG: methyltransferase domain-containing protein [Candidatus Rokuibacteriota bacterium]